MPPLEPINQTRTQRIIIEQGVWGPLGLVGLEKDGKMETAPQR